MISIREARDITISVIALSLALSIAEGGGLSVFLSPLKLLFLISFFAITVGTGFVLHELGHKFVAMKFGGYAEFKMWAQGLILALVLATFLGVVFAAPGAVYIYAPRITRKQNGLISLAGPLVNLILSVIFLALALLIPLSFGSMNIWYFASKINVWLGMFNMVPVYPLDGSKILDWNIFVWGAFAAMFALLFII